MANMSYCRFENTYSDLADCVQALRNGEEISEYEMYYAKEMRRLCERFIEEFDDYEPVVVEEEE
jgi:hypothetical protein